MEEGSTNINVVCDDFTGKNHVIVFHPAQVFQIHQLMMDAIVTPQQTRLEELQQWEKENHFVKDHYKNTIHNPEFLEYEEIINDEILLASWYEYWLGE
jgi:hypothetical protein